MDGLRVLNLIYSFELFGSRNDWKLLSSLKSRYPGSLRSFRPGDGSAFAPRGD
jgi:hypothetical protein